MKRFLAAAALLACLSPVARAYPSLLLNAVVLPCDAHAKNLELMEASSETTPCAELSTSEVAPTPEPESTPAPGEKPVTARTGKTALALPPEKANAFRLTRFEKPPVIDGKVEEEAWKSAARFKDFHQWRPSDSTSAFGRIEMRAGYDSKFIYFAFYAYDDPSRIWSSVAKHEAILDVESIGLILDAFNEKRRASEFFFNALGAQQDGFLTEGGDDDFNVEIVKESKGSSTDDGYVVEIAIPFRLLRYEAIKDKLWGIYSLEQHVNSVQHPWLCTELRPGESDQLVVRANQGFPIFLEEKRPSFLGD